MDPRFPTGKFVFVPNQTAAERRDRIAAIGSFPSELKAAMPGARVDTPYREGGWTARQVVHHLADSHMNAFVRFRLTLTEDRPTVKPYREAEWAKLADSTLDPALSIQLLDALHQRWHVMLQAMSEADFSREAIHPDHGPVTIEWFLQVYAWHGRHHIGHIKLTAA
ncbi:MAG TPA: putative metal-dependent hydrolase [Vicinamibacterales bacterium]|nr:putative metal-dependent hydrolase [Vicinamibacterales bacterium]